MIKSVIWSSMIDYPDNVCTTLFTGNCNFNCEFCYNKGLQKENEMNFKEEILPKLIERKDFVNNVLISGGECTTYKEFEEIVNTLYENGFKVGIHTNGYAPDVLEKVIDKLDYIGMDIKNDFENYDEITGKKIETDKIKKSIELILNSNINYEFRTTVYPKYVKEENLVEIAKYLKQAGSDKYVLQNYFDYNKTVEPYEVEKLKDMQSKCDKYISTSLRGIM